MSEHRCGMDVAMCMALGLHPTSLGSDSDVDFFYRRVRQSQERALRRVRARVRRIGRMLGRAL